MPEKIKLDIVTPDRPILSESVDEVQIPGKEGYLGVLPGHAPLISELTIGEISYRQGVHTSYLAVTWGFAEVLPDKVTILAERAEKAEEIDLQRALSSKARAEKRLAQVNDTDIDFQRAQLSLQRAVIRIQVAKHMGVGA
ncbi:MAG: F0F1 ATP synthase subunit epsilon [Acidobacteriia bacterium]|nr:F0F1 ATP synthase subunit epsilon [Terriglobia bacterium]